MSGLTDTQLLTMAIAIIVPLSMLLYSNSRITEAKETLRADMQALRAEMKGLSTEMNAGFERIMAAVKELDAKVEHKFEVHVLEHHHK